MSSLITDATQQLQVSTQFFLFSYFLFHIFLSQMKMALFVSFKKMFDDILCAHEMHAGSHH